MKIRLKKKIWDILRCRKVAIYQNSSGNCTRRYRFDVAPLSGLQKRKLTRGRGGRKGREKARSCFITKAADIKFHRQTWNFRVPTFVCDWRTVPTTKTVRFHWANTREKQSSFAKGEIRRGRSFYCRTCVIRS